MTFYKWLKRYNGPRWVRLGKRCQGGAVTDLRDDILHDQDWPKDAQGRKECEDAMGPMASEQALQALRVAWRLYRAEHPKRKERRAVGLTQRFRILKRDGYRCCLCGATAAHNTTLEVDHRVAASRGGNNEDSNLWTLCFECNRGKATHDV